MPEPRGRFPVAYPLTQTLVAINRCLGMNRATQRAAIESFADYTPTAAFLRRIVETVKSATAAPFVFAEGRPDEAAS